MSFDLLVLGSGYPGALMATVAAARGFRVALLDRDAQPRFAIGESTTPEQNTVHAELAKGFGAPELSALASYPRLLRATRTVPLWPKESFYFAQFDTPEQSAPHEILFQTTPWPVGPDYHCYRSAYDLHLLDLAVRRGVTLLAPASLEDLELSAEGVAGSVVRNGTRIPLEARLLVDATGFGSALANRWNVAEIERQNVPLRSRAIYSHFLGVPPVEGVVGGAARPLPLSRNHATAHLVFDGGWFWSIPFDNGITSVGVVLDCERHPLEERLTPQAELHEFADALPAAARLLEAATPIRDTERTGQLQFSLSAAHGPGWVALPPASGSVDPLMSPGNALVAKSVGRLATVLGELLATSARSDLLKEFADLQALEWTYTNRLQRSLYRSFRRRELFRSAFTLYQMASVLGAATGLGREGYRSPFHVPLWSFDLPEIRDAVDRFDELLPAPGDREAEDPTQDELNGVLREADRWGYLGSPVHRSRRPNVHLIELAHARWIATLSPQGRRPWRDRWWWRALRMLGRSSLRSRGGAGAPPSARPPRVSRLGHVRIVLSRVFP